MTFAVAFGAHSAGHLAMKIVLVSDCKIPVSDYDDKARVVWWLGKELSKAGHEVSLLLREGSNCDFAKLIIYNKKTPLTAQIPPDADFVHFHDEPQEEIEKPFLITQHDNSLKARSFHQNTVFLSDSHARMHGGSVFVYPGIDFSEYSPPELDTKRMWFHFLGNTDQRGRNIRGAIDLAAKVDTRLHVIGGSRVGFRHGLSIPMSRTARFHGSLSPGGRDALLNASKGMVFPVLWEEPFNLGVIESLFFGCPVFGTPFGAMPEMLGKKVVSKKKTMPISGTVDAFYSDYGCLSVKKTELLEAIKNPDEFDRVKCHEYALERFSSYRMAQDYLRLYEKVLSGKMLHKEAPVLEEPFGEKLLSLTN